MYRCYVRVWCRRGIVYDGHRLLLGPELPLQSMHCATGMFSRAGKYLCSRGARAELLFGGFL